jgi:hypothetical protein
VTASPPADPSKRPAAIVISLPAQLRPDLATIDLLARLQLAAGRLGLTLRVRGGGPDLDALLELTGLADVVTR